MLRNTNAFMGSWPLGFQWWVHLNSVETCSKYPARGRAWFSPVVSLRRASRRRSAAAGGSSTLFSLLRAAQPSACPEHASGIQWAESKGLRWPQDGPLTPETGLWGTKQWPEEREANLNFSFILVSSSIHWTLGFHNPWACFCAVTPFSHLLNS